MYQRSVRILVLEDDKIFSDLLKSYLEMYDYFTELCHTGVQALQKVKCMQFDLFILDLMVPEINGMQLLSLIRENDPVTPIIVITGNEDRALEIESFKKGTNIFHRKPLDTKLLLEQIRGVLRNNGINRIDCKCSEICIDDSTKSVMYKGSEIPLSPNEYSTLKLLFINKNCIVTKKQIIENLYIDPHQILQTSVDTHIARLRKKLCSQGVNDTLIQTVRGFGYKINHKNN